MPKTKNYRKTMRAFRKQYGGKRGETIFYKMRSKQRAHSPRSKWLKAIGDKKKRTARRGRR
jgi:hypothetical protein